MSRSGSGPISVMSSFYSVVLIWISIHSILTFVRTIFPGVWEVSVMRHGGQASDEIEDDLYQYNII